MADRYTHLLIKIHINRIKSLMALKDRETFYQNKDIFNKFKRLLPENKCVEEQS